MNNQQDLEIKKYLAILKNSYANKALLPILKRKQELRKLLKIIRNSQQDILQALKQDLGRCEFQSMLLEIGLIIQEIKFVLKNIDNWARPQPQITPYYLLPASSWIEPTPKGVVLIISPWNYPFQLTLLPLVSAIAAGNCAIVKPSEVSSHSAQVLHKIISQLDSSCFKIFLGSAKTAQKLLDIKFDHIFYTGSNKIAQEVLFKAAKYLCPVTLELGGKCPALITPECNLRISVKNIIWAKLVNAGQTCIAPDYVLVPRNLEENFLTLAKYYILKFSQTNYNKIINKHHVARLAEYLKNNNIFYGGSYNLEKLYFEPTIITKLNLDSLVMQEEIFGPILPVINYNNLSQALDIISNLPVPLAIYLFSKNNKLIKNLIKQTSSGSVAINNCMSQAANPHLPFGGVNHSGMGSYHGYHGFQLFSHQRSIFKQPSYIDNPLKYPPYSGGHKYLVKKLLG